MIRREQQWPFRRQVRRALGAHTPARSCDESHDREDDHAKRAQHGPRRFEGRQLRSGLRCRRAGRVDLVQQIANRQDPAQRVAGQRNPEETLDLDRQRDPLQRVDLQVELRARVERELAVGVAFAQPGPCGRRAFFLEQRAIGVAGFGCRRVRGTRSFVEQRGQQMALELAELRARQRFARHAITTDPLIRRQTCGRVLDLLAQQRRGAHCAALANCLLLEHHERGEHATVLEDTELVDQRARCV